MSQVPWAEMLFPMWSGMRCSNAETETQRDLDVRYKPAASFHSKFNYKILENCAHGRIT
jgi:hypothetical protein